jgi:hypothetical protein
VPSPSPSPSPPTAPVTPDAPEAQSAVQKLLHEMINGPSLGVAIAPPPLLTPLAALSLPPLPLEALAPEPAPPPRRATPMRHAGILREFGGVVAWMRAQAQARGESVG